MDGCNKPHDCRLGQSYDYYLFTVQNPLEVVKYGAKCVVKELDPISMMKMSYKTELNKERVDKYGLLEYKTLSSVHLLPHQVIFFTRFECSFNVQLVSDIALHQRPPYHQLSLYSCVSEEEGDSEIRVGVGNVKTMT